MTLWSARLIWFGVITSPLFYCFIAFIVVMQQGVSALEWGGFLGEAPPVRATVLLPACALLVPILLALLRAVVVAPVAGGTDALRPQDEPAVLRKWLTRQLVFLGLADVLPTLAVIHVLLWGTMPLLWLVGGEYVVVMAFYFPRLPPSLSGEA